MYLKAFNQIFSKATKQEVTCYLHSFKNSFNMSEVSFTGMKLNKIVSSLENFASLKLAEDWDNVGLLVDPIHDVVVKKVMLTNDLTEDVLQESIQANAGLIVTYHPNIFQGLKSVSSRSWKERIVVNCIKNNIAVFSPHTSWDVIRGGVNDWLTEALPVKTSLPIKENVNEPSIGVGRICKLSEKISLKEAVEKIKKHIGIEHLRLALAKNKSISDTISSMALCAGSGASVLNGVKADLYLTGEMLHHDILDATQKGISVILCNHSDSERGFLRVFQKKFQMDMLNNEVEVIVSTHDKDPLKTV